MSSEPVDLWNAVLEKEASLGRDSLTPRERTIYFVNRFICDFSNGGLSGFLYNLSPDWPLLSEFESEIRVVGCAAVADLIREVASVCAVASQLEEKRETWAQYLKRLDPTDRLVEIDMRLSGADGVLWDHLEEFTTKQA